MYTYIHIHVHMCIYTYIHTHVHICIYTYTDVTFPPCLLLLRFLRRGGSGNWSDGRGRCVGGWGCLLLLNGGGRCVGGWNSLLLLLQVLGRGGSGGAGGGRRVCMRVGDVVSRAAQFARATVLRVGAQAIPSAHQPRQATQHKHTNTARTGTCERYVRAASGMRAAF